MEWAGRPNTLHEVARRHNAGLQPFGYALDEFLDQFYTAHYDQPERCAEMLKDEPDLIAHSATKTAPQQLDALLAAVAEHLGRCWDVSVPAWTENREKRFLSSMWHWYHPDEEYMPLFERENPWAFKRRNILSEPHPLTRARIRQWDASVPGFRTPIYAPGASGPR